MSKRLFVRGGWRAARSLAAALTCFMAVMLVDSAPGHAQVYWSTSSGDWSVGSDWSGNFVPTSTDNAWIVNGGTANVTQLGETCGTLSLGSSAGSGAVQMAGGSLSERGYEYVGSSGTGTFSQSGGTNTIIETEPTGMYVGYNAGGSGAYNLSGSGLLTTSMQYVGYSTTGNFNQTGGTNTINSTASGGGIYLGYNAGGSGAYSLGGGQLLAQGWSYGARGYIGYSGIGSITQSGGLAQFNDSSSAKLYLGYNSTSNGSYNLGGGQLLVSGVTVGGVEYVGYSGAAVFTQSGGTNGISGGANCLYLGYNAGSSGAYNLSGSGLLSVAGISYVGYSGTGAFTQSGGTNTTSTTLYLSYKPGSYATYALGGSGVLSATNEYVAYDPSATALFQQTGGSNSVASLSIGNNGEYQLQGGTLQSTSGIVNCGLFNGGNSPATLVVGGILDLTDGTWQNFTCVSLSMAANSLLIMPAGFNPSSAFAGFSSSGLVHAAGTVLNVSGGTGFGGAGSINDPVNCQGSITASSTYSINLNDGLILSGSGAVNLGGGGLTVNDMMSAIGGNSRLACTNQYVGYSGTGSLTQSGGTSTISAYSGTGLYLGHNAADVGAYTLSGTGQLSTFSQYVGYYGTGIFTQSGGTNTINYYNTSGGLYIGYNAGSNGTYYLNGPGQLQAYDNYGYGNRVCIGFSGTGSFVQSAGTNTTMGYPGGIYLGYNSGAAGSYDLHGTGLLNVEVLTIGLSGTGSFTQSGGTNTITATAYVGALYVGSNAGSYGSYVLSSGLLCSASNGNVTNEYVGYYGTGIFTQSGGTNTTPGTLYLGYYGGTGTYNLNGGLLSIPSLVGGAQTAFFNFNGGTLQANGSFSTTLPMTLGISGGGATIDTAGHVLTLSGPLSGPGSLTKIDSGTLTLAATNTYSGNTLIGGGTLVLGSPLALQDSTFDTSGSGTLSFGSLTAATLGGLTGPGTLALSNSAPSAVALSVGNNNAGTTYSGTLQGAGSLNKVGSGTLAFSGSNTYSGPTTISQGKLTIDGWLTNSAVSVNGGTLGGTGYLGSVTVSASGTLAPGDPLGVLHLSGNLVLAAGAGMDYDLGGFSTDDDVSMPSGTLTFSGQGFPNFGFTWSSGFGPGTYTLVNAKSISGLGTSLSGSIDGLPATLSVQNNDLMLTVVPESSTAALLGAGILGLIGWACWRRRLAAQAVSRETPTTLSFPTYSSHIEARRRAAMHFPALDADPIAAGSATSRASFRTSTTPARVVSAYRRPVARYEGSERSLALRSDLGWVCFPWVFSVVGCCARKGDHPCLAGVW